jgi:hypothetical protein
MSSPFSDTTNYSGIVQFYEKEIGVDYGTISGDETALRAFTSEVNLALVDFVGRAIKASGTAQFDDSNHTKYPIITFNLVANQRDYFFTTDQQGNLILDIYRVMVADANGVFRDITPLDQQTANNNNSDTSTFVDGRNTTGTPKAYDKTGKGIFFDVLPSYSYTGGVKVFINREGSSFTYTDTDRKAGVPGLFHKYFWLKPALNFARINSLASYNRIAETVLKIEGDETKGIVGEIEQFYNRTQKDVKGRMRANVENTK